MKRLVALALLLAGCGERSADETPWAGREWDVAELVIAKREYDSLAALRAEAARRGVRPERHARGIDAFVTIAADRSRCTIHFVNPDRAEVRDMVGHEAMHCFYGHWHG